MLLRPRADDYETSHPSAADVFLLVEVSDSSLAYDRGAKLALYARFGVAEVWIIDIAGSAVEIYRQPKEGVYSLTERRTGGIPHAGPSPKRRDRRRRAARVNPTWPLSAAADWPLPGAALGPLAAAEDALETSMSASGRARSPRGLSAGPISRTPAPACGSPANSSASRIWCCMTPAWTSMRRPMP